LPFALIIHGGADPRLDYDYSKQIDHLAELIELGKNDLKAGQSAIDTVTLVVKELEKSGLYIAGKGASPNLEKKFELDASIMEGSGQRAGAVAAIQNVVHPIEAARTLLDDGQAVMLAGAGATDYARNKGLEQITDPEQYYSPIHEPTPLDRTEKNHSHGTVGAVCLDLEGYLAAATSTGGTLNKPPGRIGDSPLIGSGTWADDQVAVSCTGAGEFFIRSNAAHTVAARMRFGGACLEEACLETLSDVARLQGRGGLIAVDKSGNMTMVYNSRGMKRASVSDTSEAKVRIFDKPEKISL